MSELEYRVSQYNLDSKGVCLQILGSGIALP